MYSPEWLKEHFGADQAAAILSQSAGRPMSTPTDSTPPLESEIQAEALKLLRELRELGQLMVVRTNSGSLAGTYHQATEPGMSDIIVAICGQVIFLEFKRPGEGLRPEQFRFRAECEASGNRYEIAESVDDVRALLREHGIEI